MAISPLKLQQRLAEGGRIRLGEVKTTGSGKSFPSKLDKFRFTSADKHLLELVAAEYGGEVQEWTPANGGASQWEVYSDRSSVPVIIYPNSISQHMELWSGGGCQRRCDGIRESITDVPCICAAEDRELCKPTTRLSVMLAEIQGTGVWRLESKGWNAAAELPMTAEFLAQTGGYIPADLSLKAVRQISDGKTKDFMVPALAVRGVTPAQLLAGGGASPVAAVGQGSAPALGAAAPALGAGGRNWLAEAQAAVDVDTVRDIWNDAGAAGALDDSLKAALTARGEALKAADVEIVDGQLEDSPGGEVDELWGKVMAEAGRVGWTTSKVKDEFARVNGGLFSDDADAEQLVDFLALLAEIADAA